MHEAGRVKIQFWKRAVYAAKGFLNLIIFFTFTAVKHTHVVFLWSDSRFDLILL